jgi:flagellar biosynthesis/type III secretory pathway protein FliH
VNSFDFENLSEEINQLISDNPFIKIIASPDIKQGEVHIESQEQIIEFSVEDRFKEIKNAINSVSFTKD